MVTSDIGQTDRRKTKGQVFTPGYMVRAMLDWCGYVGQDILCKHIADNSCGDGAFLCEVFTVMSGRRLTRVFPLPLSSVNYSCIYTAWTMTPKRWWLVVQESMQWLPDTASPGSGGASSGWTRWPAGSIMA